MSIHRSTIWLTVFGSILITAPSATAQPRDINPQYGTVRGPSYAYGNAQYSTPNPTAKPAHTPFAPVQFEHDWQPFAPADISEYGNSPKRRYGFFASYERLYWSISKPPRDSVGSKYASVGIDPQTGERFKYYQPDSNLEFNLLNSFDTGTFNGDFGWGNRYDLGWVDMDNKGWMVSILSNLSQNQTYGHGRFLQPGDPGYDENNPQTFGYQGGIVLFEDPLGMFVNYTDFDHNGFDDDRNGNHIFGRDGRDTSETAYEPDEPYSPPDAGLRKGYYDPNDPTADIGGDQVRFAPIFGNLKMANRVEFNGVELMRTWRIPRFHDGSDFQLLFGARYLQVKDRFTLEGTGGTFDAMWMNTTIQNEIVGPQLGFRWSHQRNRWTVSAEGRFVAGANFQNGNQNFMILTNNYVTPAEEDTGDRGSTAGQHPPVPPTRNAPGITTLAARNNSHNTEFTPVGELRVQTSYFITRAVALKLGYTLLYADGIQRAGNSVVYRVPDLGIKNNHGDDYILTNGVSFGVEINR